MALGAFVFNPTPSESQILASVAQRESNSNYQATVSPATCAKSGATYCSASGAYMFIDSTWQQASAATGVGYPDYPTAASAPASIQDTNALWLLRAAGGDPNASMAWGASAPGGPSPIFDLSGAAANIPTADILSQIEQSLPDLTQYGIDQPTELAILAIGAVGVLVFAASA